MHAVGVRPVSPTDLDSLLRDMVPERGYNSTQQLYYQALPAIYRQEDDDTKDLLAYLDKELGVSPSRNQLGITGVSAGGVKALTVAFHHPERFGSVTAHSAGIQPADPADMPDWARDWEGWEPSYGAPIDVDLWQAQNPIHLAGVSAAETLSELAIYFDVGADDHLGFHRTSGLLSAALAANRVPHEFAVRVGGHGSDYYRSAIPHSLRFHGRAFEASR